MPDIPINTSDRLLRSDGLSEAELAERVAHSGAADHIIKRVFRENAPLADDIIRQRSLESQPETEPSATGETHCPDKTSIVTKKEAIVITTAAGMLLGVLGVRQVMKHKKEGEA